MGREAVSDALSQVARCDHLRATSIRLTDSFVLLLFQKTVHGANETSGHKVLECVPLIVVELAQLLSIKKQILFEICLQC